MLNSKIKKKSTGRKKGYKLEAPPIMFDRWELMYYTTIKNGKGRVVGKDYSQSAKHLSKREKIKAQAHSDDAKIFIMALKKAKFKEDIFKARPDLLVHLDKDGSIDKDQIKPDRLKSLAKLETECFDIHAYLINHNMTPLAGTVMKSWGKLKEASIPPKVKSRERTKVNQLAAMACW